MSKLRKGPTNGNVTQLVKPKSWTEHMTYGELLSERRFMRQEKKRINRAREAALKVDPRGMWVELHEIDQMFAEMLKTCDYAIAESEKQMILRMEKNK